ncbi:uncharacterized protein Dvar_78090 [Desulfosarcina variabilis str. Montpellier]|uniref:hypothetical protein n=1 Tax=Desulfosarcina variabilis TaxID=2300 RepID=UPI003AFB0492
MDFNAPEIVKVLETQRRFHQEQLRLIDIALAAIAAAGGAGAKKPAMAPAKIGNVKKHHIQWTREIGRLLDDYDEFTFMDIQSDLAEKRDIAAAMTIQGQNVIHNTLNRYEKKGRIQKLSPGVYRVIKESLPIG